MAFRPVIHGYHIKDHKYKFEGRNTRRSSIYRASGNTYREVYERLVEMDVITRYDEDPEMKYVLDKTGKTYDDFTNEDGDTDYEAILNYGGVLDDDEAYYHIISNEDGDAFYQEWLEDEDDEADEDEE